jgi:hypothetical protein
MIDFPTSLKPDFLMAKKSELALIFAKSAGASSWRPLDGFIPFGRFVVI